MYYWFCVIFSASDGLLAVTGNSLSNYFIVYLINGRVAVTFSAEGDGAPPSTITSADAYNDAIIHRLRVLYNDGTIRMIIDGADRRSTEGINNRYQWNNNYKYYVCVVFQSSSTLSVSLIVSGLAQLFRITSLYLPTCPLTQLLPAYTTLPTQTPANSNCLIPK